MNFYTLWTQIMKPTSKKYCGKALLYYVFISPLNAQVDDEQIHNLLLSTIS
jgi:hypothetical protein